MKIRTFALTTAAALFVAGSAFAQTNSQNMGGDNNGSGTALPSKPSMETTQSTGGMQYKSDEERMMYTDNSAMMRPFFTDDSMSTLKDQSEIQQTFSAMDAESQAGMKSACQKAEENRGSYGSVTIGLCQSIMAM